LTHLNISGFPPAFFNLSSWKPEPRDSSFYRFDRNERTAWQDVLTSRSRMTKSQTRPHKARPHKAHDPIRHIRPYMVHLRLESTPTAPVGRLREISVFLLTKRIKDVPGIPVMQLTLKLVPFGTPCLFVGIPSAIIYRQAHRAAEFLSASPGSTVLPVQHCILRMVDTAVTLRR